MAVKDIEIEDVKRIHHDGVTVEVGTAEENDDYIEFRNGADKESKAHYGEFRVIFPANLAVAVGKALVSLGTAKGGKFDE